MSGLADVVDYVQSGGEYERSAFVPYAIVVEYRGKVYMLFDSVLKGVRHEQ